MCLGNGQPENAGEIWADQQKMEGKSLTHQCRKSGARPVHSREGGLVLGGKDGKKNPFSGSGSGFSSLL